MSDATYEDLMQEVLAELASEQAWDSDFTANPHSAEGAATRIAKLGPAVIPSIMKTVEQEDATRAKYALVGLRTLARSHAIDSAVVDWLAGLAPVSTDVALALYCIDAARALALDLHRSPHCWQQIYWEAKSQKQAAQHVARLLEDPEHPIVPIVLGKPGGIVAGTPLSNLPPDLVPIDLVRVLARSSNPHVRAVAVHHLAELHNAEDAYLVLAHALQTSTKLERQRSHDVRWLAPLDGSTRLLPQIDDDQLFELVRRRRCAGLATPDARERAHAVVAKGLGKPWPTDMQTMQLVVELGDLELTETLLSKIPEDFDFRLDYLRDCLRGERAAWMSIEHGDDRFTRGRIDECTLVDDPAYAAYAYTLLFEPGNAHAALQIAWIDRAWGTPITPKRIAWLRDLGVRDESMLEELAIPVPPFPGIRRMEEFSKPHSAAPAEAACLWSMAAFHSRTKPDEKARLEALAARHMERVRNATRARRES